MAIVTGIDIGKELLKALGMEKLEVKEIHIHVVPDDKVRIETVQFIRDEQFNKLKEIFKKLSFRRR
jgi:hypothetical protein